MEDELTKPKSIDALLKCFVSAKANSFENLLDPLLKICRISNTITIGLAKSAFFKRIIDRLGPHHSKAVVRLNLLRILRTVCDVHPNRAILVERYGLYEIVERLSRDDGAVLVRELAREIVPALAPALKEKSREGQAGTPAKVVAPKKMRRAASETSSSTFGLVRGEGGGRTNGGMAPASRLVGEAGRVKTSRQRLGDIPWQSSR